ncbi:MAG TPA: hypothetical protein VF573_24705 [Paraburkholderia sp.]|uniref:hypothetical protein n=1 Tax=Paraburkholderia sp. TaxID=1926495 RepID=UPI002ED4F92A
MFAPFLDTQLQFVTKSTGKIQIPVRIFFIDFLRARLNCHEMRCGRGGGASNPAFRLDAGNFCVRRFARNLSGAARGAAAHPRVRRIQSAIAACQRREVGRGAFVADAIAALVTLVRSVDGQYRPVFVRVVPVAKHKTWTHSCMGEFVHEAYHRQGLRE